MRILLAAACYLVLHLAFYTFLLRRLKPFRSETSIFVYHLLSFVLLGVMIVPAALLVSTDPLAVTVAGMCLHAIYSMSFLEAWSLTEGSLYFRLLDQLAASHTIRIAGSADSHRDARVESLLRLKLLRRDGADVCLTFRGQVVRAGLDICAWFFAGKAP